MIVQPANTKIQDNANNFSAIFGSQATLPKADVSTLPPQLDGSIVFNAPNSLLYYSANGMWIQIPITSSSPSLLYQNLITNNGNPFNSFYINTSNLVLPALNNNDCVGVLCGDNITTGTNNAFFGTKAGQNITTQSFDTFIGSNAGGIGSATNSTFVGYNCGVNATGDQNCFFGVSGTGLNNSGNFNVMMGNGSGQSNTIGSQSVIIGHNAGNSQTTGIGNSYIGFQSGMTNITGSNNSFFGKGSDAFTSALTYATAIGADTVVMSNNTIQLGRNTLDNVIVGNNLTVNGTSTFLNKSSFFYQNNINNNGNPFNSFYINTSGLTLGANLNNLCLGVGSGNALTTGNANVF